MSLPVFNFATLVTTNITICEIHPAGSIPFGVYASSPKIFLPVGQNQSPTFDLITYYILGGSTGVGTVVTFQVLNADGTWRALVSGPNVPGPVTIANSTPVDGFFNGPWHGVRLSVSGAVGNGVAFAELIGTVRDK